MQVGYKTDIGNIRKTNEDSYFVDKNKEIFIITDGVGGQQGGEIASQLAVSEVVKFFSKYAFSNRTKKLENSHKEILNLIQQAIQKANETIYRSASESLNLNGMATTIVLALRFEDNIHIGHVGDSRAYLIRDDMITQITDDHSLVKDLVRIGELSAEETHTHHLRHVITRSLGTKEKINVDITSISWKENDYFLICTDGLTDMLRDNDMKTIILNEREPSIICEKLIESAKKMGGQDNITVVILYIDESWGSKSV